MDRINLPANLLIFPIILLAIYTDTFAFVHPARMVAAGEKYTIGLTAFGTVLAVGDNVYGECDTTPANGFANIVQIDAGFYHTIGLKANGTVVAVGENTWGSAIQVGLSHFPQLILMEMVYRILVTDVSPPLSAQQSIHTAAL